MKRSLLFDLVSTQPYGLNKRHGGGLYGEIVLRNIIKKGLPISCFYDSKNWFDPNIKNEILEHNINLYDIRQTSLNKIISTENIGCLYTSSDRKDLCYIKDINIIITQHDLRQYELPIDSFFWRYKNTRIEEKIKFFIRKIYPQIGYTKSGTLYEHLNKNPRLHCVTVSNHSKYMIKCFFPKITQEIPVFYSPSTSIYNINKTKYTDKYFLMVSGNRWEKNNLRAIIALDHLISNGYLKDYKVKITGADSANNFRYKIKNPSHFSFLGYVDDIELSQLYHDAYCFIFPSLNEGFGYPPIEAMHYGIPVIASAISSIPEICGGHALYFNPFSIKEIENRILMILDKDIHSNYSIYSLKQFEIIKNKQNEDLNKLIEYIYKYV